MRNGFGFINFMQIKPYCSISSFLFNQSSIIATTFSKLSPIISLAIPISNGILSGFCPLGVYVAIVPIGKYQRMPSILRSKPCKRLIEASRLSSPIISESSNKTNCFRKIFAIPTTFDFYTLRIKNPDVIGSYCNNTHMLRTCRCSCNSAVLLSHEYSLSRVVFKHFHKFYLKLPKYSLTLSTIDCR